VTDYEFPHERILSAFRESAVECETQSPLDYGVSNEKRSPELAFGTNIRYNASLAGMLNAVPNCFYLQDEGIELFVPVAGEGRGVKVYGSPWQCSFLTWGFARACGLRNGKQVELQKYRGSEVAKALDLAPVREDDLYQFDPPTIREAWERIPDETDILVTHQPALGRCDGHKNLMAMLEGRETDRDLEYVRAHGTEEEKRGLCNEDLGCYWLRKEIEQRVKPSLHCAGHTHLGRGVDFDGTTRFVNGAVRSEDYDHTVAEAIAVDVPLGRVVDVAGAERIW
jgi:hypothetical protein